MLVSTRWLRIGAAAAVAALIGLALLPHRLRLRVLIAGWLSGMATFATAVLQARRLTFEQITLPIPGLPAALDGVTIAQLSDLHLGNPFVLANIERAKAWVQQRQPDVVVFTGDFLNDSRDLPLLRAALAGIHAPHGVYAIFGNHDHWTDLAALADVLDECGIDVLRNARRALTFGETTLYVVGIDCVWEAQHDLPQALADLPADATTIVLAHEPDIADEVAAYPVALQLSGHTHGGHITLPGLGPLFLPRHGFRYAQGLQRVGGMWLYVSRGLGGMPLRLGSPPEVTLLTLRAEASAPQD